MWLKRRRERVSKNAVQRLTSPNCDFDFARRLISQRHNSSSTHDTVSIRTLAMSSEDVSKLTLASAAAATSSTTTSAPAVADPNSKSQLKKAAKAAEREKAKLEKQHKDNAQKDTQQQERLEKAKSVTIQQDASLPAAIPCQISQLMRRGVCEILNFTSFRMVI